MVSAQWRPALGPRADRYLKAFARIEANGGKWTPGWNWAAFFGSTIWFLYRRMYLCASLNLLGPPLLWVVLPVILFSVPFNIEPGLEPAIAIVVLQLVAVFLLVPVFGDSIYYRHLKAKIARTGAATVKQAPSWGTAAGAFVIGVVLPGMVLAAVTSAYRDNWVRGGISEAMVEALALRMEITEFHDQNKRLPNQAEGDALRASPPSKRVKSVAWDASGERLVITMRDPFPDKRIAFPVTVQEGKLSWTCRSIDVERKSMPASCRD